METLFQDFRYALRKLIKSPTFTIVTLLTLVLAIGANSAIFSLINAILLRPLPFNNPDRLMVLWATSQEGGKSEGFTSPLNFVDWQSSSQSFEEIEAFRYWAMNVTGDAQPERVWGARVSGGLFNMLGVNPKIGRAFVQEEDKPGKDNVVVISHGLWQRRFGSDPNVLERQIPLNGRSYNVIGVMDSDFQFPVKGLVPILTQTQAEFWIPLAFDNEQAANPGRVLVVVGRLKEGVSREQAQSEMGSIMSRLEQQYPVFNSGWGVRVTPLQEQIVGGVRPTLLLLSIAVGFVLLIACANVASLLLARGATRQKEIALRAALGATRTRLMRQLLTESVVLSLLGGLLGVVLSFWCVRALVAVSPDVVPITSEVKIDATVLGFGFLISLLTGLVFGLLPALETSRLNLNQLLKEGAKELMGSPHRIHLRSILVVSEVALASLLLIAAGLMIRSFLRLQQVDPGFNPEKILTMQLDLPLSKYRERKQRVAFYDAVLARLEALPGVEKAGAVSTLPLGGEEEENAFIIEGRPLPPSGQPPMVPSRAISPNYFQTMGIPVLQGRPFELRDNLDAPGAAIINQSMADRFWPGEDPLGKRISLGGSSTWRTIVGIVGDVRHADLSAQAKPEMYFPYLQMPLPFMVMVVRTTIDPANMIGTVRTQTLEVDKDQPVSNIKTMDQLISASVSRPRLRTLLIGLFAAVAMVLAMIGVYGLLSYSVTQRSREIGIRMALGAQRSDVLKQIMKQGITLALVGIVIGAVLALVLTRVLGSMLYGISTTDPFTFALVSMALACVAMIATYIPARRATTVDPMVALRES
jgi:putative ABC transport system permease protein